MSNQEAFQEGLPETGVRVAASLNRGREDVERTQGEKIGRDSLF
jgi:hypothetical protein